MFHLCVDFDFRRIINVTIHVHPDRSAGRSGSAQTENNSTSVRENQANALKIEFFKPNEKKI